MKSAIKRSNRGKEYQPTTVAKIHPKQWPYMSRFGMMPVDEAKKLGLVPLNFTFDNAQWKEIDKRNKR